MEKDPAKFVGGLLRIDQLEEKVGAAGNVLSGANSISDDLRRGEGATK
jgi:hypothetical protein